jgi:predicted NBD/HSP70 family sugar kinase
MMTIQDKPYNQPLRIIPPLGKGFRPAAVLNRAFLHSLKEAGEGQPLVLGMERPDGSISRFETQVFPDKHPEAKRNIFYIERILKFLLWQRGGNKIFIGGAKSIGKALQRIYSTSGERAFDYSFMGEKVYLKDLSIVPCKHSEVPGSKEIERKIGHHLEGCRIGFDLGASDLKVSALIDGETIFSTEIEWDPRNHSDPKYHKEMIVSALNMAKDKLPRLDAIGGSSAGVIINNQPMVASLFRGIPEEKFDEVRRIFLDIESEFEVPVQVANDGEVTALAGSMSMGLTGLLGIAMGSSEAAGYVTLDGNITNWLNELAFGPIDFDPNAPIDEWSGDKGCGGSYLSQQCVFRLAETVGITIPQDLSKAKKLEYVQELLEGGHQGAQQIWDSMGCYAGYAIAHYADFYHLNHVLIMGRCTSGVGGQIILKRINEVMQAEFPVLSSNIKIHLPDELSRRVGQAIAAASIPEV